MKPASRQKLVAILEVLAEADRPMGSNRIAQALELAGKPMSQRTVRYYLGLADGLGLTKPVGRRGRVLTHRGRLEVESAQVVKKVGFVAARVDELTYKMDFRLRQGRGSVVVNIYSLPAEALEEAKRLMRRVYEAGLAMGRRLAVVGPGQRLGPVQAGDDEAIVATICSVSINGVLLAHGIPTTSRFGGLLQLAGGKPAGFTQIITYEGTTVDPLEIFIKGRMTSVLEAASSGEGVVGASFREVPAAAADAVARLGVRMQRAGLGGVLLVGRPGQALLDVPVSPGRVGIVVLGGLNPLAAVEEAAIPTTNRAMGTMMGFEQLTDFTHCL